MSREDDLRELLRLKPYPKLPAPTDLPRFAEEGERDPFGQDEELLAAAVQRASKLVIELANAAHAGGLCVMLPSPEPGTIDPSLRPWRSVVSCEPDAPGLPALEIPDAAIASEPVRAASAQTLVQRTALCLSALGADAPAEAHDQAAELLEHLGYIALGREFQALKVELGRFERAPLQFFHSLGKTAAQMHDKNIIHGDMHPGNFPYDAEKRVVVLSDTDTVYFLERPITLEERASDVGLLKLTCSFEEWETVKLGYREQSPGEASRVFKLV
jgi:hypothetical protein